MIVSEEGIEDEALLGESEERMGGVSCASKLTLYTPKPVPNNLFSSLTGLYVPPWIIMAELISRGKLTAFFNLWIWRWDIERTVLGAGDFLDYAGGKR